MNELTRHTESKAPSFADMIDAARSWPREGFGEGRWFHAMADWMERAKAALDVVGAKEGMTLLGGLDCADPERAFQLGAACAFNQCAEIAKEALTDEDVTHGK